jgi:GMP synthase (glutamine-hydrolysing)
MPKILIVDNHISRDDWGATELRDEFSRISGATVYTRRAPELDLPKNLTSYDHIVVSGSITAADASGLWISQLIELIKKTIEAGKPFLGVCFGHQLLARALGGESTVGQTATPEYGWTKIQVKKPAEIFNGLPESFYSYSSHRDEVTQLHADLVPLASSERCQYQAMQLSGKPIFGIQFHPERKLEVAEQTLQMKKKKNPKDPTLLGVGIGKKLYDPQVSQKIFENFVRLA